MNGEPSTLVISEQNPSLAEFFPEDLILGTKILDPFLLLAIDLACDDEQKQLPRLKNKVHGVSDAVDDASTASGLAWAVSIGYLACACGHSRSIGSATYIRLSFFTLRRLAFRAWRVGNVACDTSVCKLSRGPLAYR